MRRQVNGARPMDEVFANIDGGSAPLSRTMRLQRPLSHS